MESNKSMKQFHDNLLKMDDKLISEGMKQSLAWFKKKKKIWVKESNHEWKLRMKKK